MGLIPYEYEYEYEYEYKLIWKPVKSHCYFCQLAEFESVMSETSEK